MKKWFLVISQIVFCVQLSVCAVSQSQSFDAITQHVAKAYQAVFGQDVLYPPQKLEIQSWDNSVSAVETFIKHQTQFELSDSLEPFHKMIIKMMKNVKQLHSRIVTTYLAANKLFFSKFSENRDRATMNNTAEALRRHVILELEHSKKQVAQMMRIEYTFYENKQSVQLLDMLVDYLINAANRVHETLSQNKPN